MPSFETHALTAPTTFFFINIFQGFDLTVEVVAASLAGGTLSDIDSATSVVGRTFPVVRIARRLGFTVEHRGFFHSLNYLGLMAVLLCPLIWTEHLGAYMAFLLSMLQHQALDGLTPEPIRWLAPFSRAPFRLAPNPEITIPNGSSKEVTLRWVLFVIMLVLGIINYIQPRWILNAYFRDVIAGQEYIHEYGDHFQFTAQFTGKELISKKVVQAQWPVEGFINGQIILRGPDGKLRSIVNSYDSDATLRSEKIRIYKGQQIEVETRSIDMAGKPLAQLRQFIDTRKHYRLFTKDLILDEPVFLTQDPILFNPVKASGKHLTLEFATLKDLLPVKDAVIEQGEIFARYHLKPGEVLDTEIPPENPWKIIEITIDKLTDLRVKKGDEVKINDLIAVRKDFVQKIRLNEQAQANTQDKIKALEELQKEAQASFASQKDLLQSRIQDAERDLQAHQYLLEKNNVSRQEVIKKQLNVKSVNTQMQQLYLQIEQQAAHYHEQLAELQLTLQRLQAELSHLKEKAFIHIRTQGKIQDIKFTQSNGEIKAKLFVEPAGKRISDE